MKTTIEYLQALEDELKYLPKKEVRRVVQIYQDKINNAIDCGEKIDKVLIDTLKDNPFFNKGLK